MMNTPQQSQPIINMPPVLWASIAFLAGVFVMLKFVLSPEDVYISLENFALFPSLFAKQNFIETNLSDYMRYLTYGFIHLDTLHFGMNAIWLVVFGAPLARLSTSLYITTLLLGIIMGGLAYTWLNPKSLSFLIGSSAGVSALLGALLRIGFTHSKRNIQKLRPFSAMLSDKQTLVFLGIWLFIEVGVNGLLGGLFSSAPIAWQAHIGGFVWGIIWVSLYFRHTTNKVN